MKAAVTIIGVMLGAVCLYAQNQAAATVPTPTPAPPQEVAGDEALHRAGGLPPRASAADYQARMQAGKITIAAEFQGHSIATLQGGPYTSEDFVAVETAFFGPPGAKLIMSYQDFSLRINGKKLPLPGAPYLEVFKSLKDPEWEPTKAEKDKGKTSIGGGGGGQNDDLPAIVHMPIEMQRAMQQRVQKVSLGEGDRPLPQAGILFFEYHGEAKNIRSMELIYNGPAGKASMSLPK